jgi:hypothetical protein
VEARAVVLLLSGVDVMADMLTWLWGMLVGGKRALLSLAGCYIYGTYCCDSDHIVPILLMRLVQRLLGMSCCGLADRGGLRFGI